MTKLKTIATVSVALAAAALPLSAANASKTEGVLISYADLNLATEAGQDVFDKRIERAINAVCGSKTKNPRINSIVRKCERQARSVAHKKRDIAVASYGSEQFAYSRREIRLAAR